MPEVFQRISHCLKAKTSCLYKDGNTYSYSLA